MIISDLYNVIITSNKYETNIGSDDVIITVLVQDFNNQPVTGKSLRVKVDKGYFTKKQNSSISGTSTTQFDMQTDSNGKITAQWKATDWGLATFTVENKAHIQVLVKGWKTIYTHADTGSYMKTNGEIVDYHIVTPQHTENLQDTDYTYLGGYALFSGDNTRYNPPVIFHTNVKGIQLKFKTASADDASKYTQVSKGQVFLSGTSLKAEGSSINNYSFIVDGTYALRE